MTHIERLEKVLIDHAQYRGSVEQQIARDKLQIEANEDTLKQIDTITGAVTEELKRLSVPDPEQSVPAV